MNRILLALAFVVAALAGIAAQELVTLTSPVVTTKSTVHVSYIGFAIDAGTIIVELKDNNGVITAKVYDATTTPTGASLLTTVNTSDNRTVSLIKKVYNRLIADGVITGSVSGTPQ